MILRLLLTFALVFSATQVTDGIYSTACYGTGDCDKYSMNCAQGEIIRLYNLYAGYKNTSLYPVCGTANHCDSSSTCCDYNSANDVIELFNMENIYRTYMNCSGKTTCDEVHAPWQQMTANSALTTSYVKVEYGCDTASEKVPFCGGPTGTVTHINRDVQILFDGSAEKFDPLKASKECKCDVTNLGDKQNVVFTALDVRLQTYYKSENQTHASCSSALFQSPIFGAQCHESGRHYEDNFYVNRYLTLLMTSQQTVQISLKDIHANGRQDSPAMVWISLRAGVNNGVRVTCKEVTSADFTTTTTTTPTTTTTTITTTTPKLTIATSSTTSTSTTNTTTTTTTNPKPTTTKTTTPKPTITTTSTTPKPTTTTSSTTFRPTTSSTTSTSTTNTTTTTTTNPKPTTTKTTTPKPTITTTSTTPKPTTTTSSTTFRPTTSEASDLRPGDGDCEPSPCVNGGSCEERVNGYKCYCLSGFDGENCQIDIDECLSTPCQSNGNCLDDVNGYTCECTQGYKGDRCQIEAESKTSLILILASASGVVVVTITVTLIGLCWFRHRMKRNNSKTKEDSVGNSQGNAEQNTYEMPRGLESDGYTTLKENDGNEYYAQIKDGERSDYLNPVSEVGPKKDEFGHITFGNDENGIVRYYSLQDRKNEEYTQLSTDTTS